MEEIEQLFLGWWVRFFATGDVGPRYGPLGPSAFRISGAWGTAEVVEAGSFKDEVGVQWLGLALMPEDADAKLNVFVPLDGASEYARRYEAGERTWAVFEVGSTRIELWPPDTSDQADGRRVPAP